MKSKKYCLKSIAFAFFALFLFLVPVHALPEEAYVFQRMWPTLQQPWYFGDCAIAIDTSGNVYVSNFVTHRIQKFTSSGQFMTEWGGNGWGDGQLHHPKGIAIDTSGNIYVADSANARIQKFTSSGQFVTKWGSYGSGDGQFEGPFGVAIDTNENVYVVDKWNHRIQKFTSSGQFIMKWGSFGTGDGQFDNPYSIAIDTNGNVYVADWGNARIQKFTSEGVFITKWGSYGSGDGQFNWPQGIAVDTLGNIYVADVRNTRVQKFTSSGEFVTKWGSWGIGDGQFENPYGIATDTSGNVYVADYGNARIQKFTSSGEFMAKWGSSGGGDGQFNSPQDIAVDKSGNVYVADTDNARIQKFTSEGKFVTKWGRWGSGDGQFYHPYGIAIDTSGNVYVADFDNHRIQKFTSTGVFITKWGTPGDSDGQFNRPGGIAIDTSGNVYVADTLNHRIQKFTSSGQFVTKWGSEGSGDGQFNEPRDIVINTSGNVYVVDFDNHRIQKFTSEGVFLAKWGDYGRGDGQFDRPHGIAIDTSGNVYVADWWNHRIQKFTTDGSLITKWGEPGSGPGLLSVPASVAVHPSGVIYVVEEFNNRVQAFSPGTVPLPGQAVDKAIIVAGGGPFAGNNLWDATQMLANYACRALTYQGYTKDTIYYLTSDTGLDLDGNGLADDVDADATNSNLQTAITSWAQDADNLLIYMVDHGGSGTFRMGATELLYATDLDTWLDGIQQTIPGTVTLIYDACRSGSFLASLAPPSGKERILATSASADQESLFTSQGTISFSFLFWARMFNGDSFYDSFYQAMNSIGATYHQSPQLDGNGNGTGNEQADLEAARGITIGNETKSAGDIPYISSVSPPQTLSGGTSAAIYADGVTDADGISRVWAVITPPGYSSADPDIPVTDLPILELPSTGGSRYQATYNSFGSSGTYNIAVYAMDGGTVISLPKTTTVSQGASVSLLYYPHVDTTSGWETEIAAINTGTRQAACTLNGYSGDGVLVESKSITLNAKGRSEMTVSQAFANHSSIKYFTLSSDTGSIKGYTKFYQIGQHRVAIPAVSEINASDIYVSHIASDADWWTGISLVNTTSTAKDLVITFNNGQSKTVPLGANGHNAFTIAQLFGQPQPEITSAVITNAGGVIGLELFGSQGDSGQLDGLPLTDDTTTTLYYPHVASDAEWWTGVVAYNPSETGCDITITPYSAGGAVLAASTLNIAGKGKYIGLVSSLGLPTETAWFRIDSTQPLSGFELFCTLPDEGRLGAYARMGSAGGTEGVFAKIEKDGWTGIAFVNAGEATAVVTLIAYDDSGVVKGASSILLNPHARVVNLVEKLFLQDITEATYITYSSNQNVVGFQLNGSADGTMLDGLPGM